MSLEGTITSRNPTLEWIDGLRREAGFVLLSTFGNGRVLKCKEHTGKFKHRHTNASNASATHVIFSLHNYHYCQHTHQQHYRQYYTLLGCLACSSFKYTESHVIWNPPTSIQQLFCVVTNSFPTAVVAYCHGGFHVKWDAL
jgi:hypothetical protein